MSLLASSEPSRCRILNIKIPHVPIATAWLPIFFYCRLFLFPSPEFFFFPAVLPTSLPAFPEPLFLSYTNPAKVHSATNPTTPSLNTTSPNVFVDSLTHNCWKMFRNVYVTMKKSEDVNYNSDIPLW